MDRYLSGKMLVSSRLQIQLASIMDSLAKAAVAEICKLIDDGSAVWHHEMSRSQKENETLRRKLLLLESELRTARGHRREDLQEKKIANGRTVGIQFAAVEEDVADVICIKEERVEMDLKISESAEEWTTDRDRDTALWSSGCHDGGERCPTGGWDMVPVPAQGVEESTESLWPGHTMEGQGGVRTAIKMEDVCEDVTQRLNHFDSEHSPGKAGDMCSEHTAYGIESEGLTDTEEDGLEHGVEEYSVIEVDALTLLAAQPGHLRGHVSMSEATAGPNSNLSETHVRAGVGRKQITCVYCGKCFSYLSYLKRHMRVHTGEKPYSCTQCGKRFSDRSSRNKHKRIHTGKKPFRCSQCEKCFSRRYHLNRHQKLHAAH